MINAVLDEIIERLKVSAGVSQASVESFPDNPDEFGDPRGGQRIFVGYTGSTVAGDSIKSSFNARNLRITVRLVSHELRSERGSHDLIDAVYKSLNGFELASAWDRMIPIGDDFRDFSDGANWTFDIRFQVLAPPY